MASPGTPGGATWIAHISPDGRPYWNNTQTKQSVWEKPSELKSPIELEMEKTPWREYETAGRKYWVHKDTKDTTWEMPQVLQDILARAAQESPAFSSAQPPPPIQPHGTPLSAQSGALVASGGFLPPGIPPRPQVAPAPMPVVIPDFPTHEAAERAFMDMLKTLGVTIEWTWEQTMRETITEPMYKALKTLADRKAAFEHYIQEIKDNERAERQKSLDKCRKEFHRALDKLGGGTEREDGFKSWWGLEKAFFECEKRLSPEVWNGPRNDEERRALIDEFSQALKAKELSRKRDFRLKNMEKISSILQTLQLDLAGPVRWRDAKATIMHTPTWQHDPDLQRIDPIDILNVYEEELKKAEKESTEQRNRTFEERRRRGRKAREDFGTLLDELSSAGVITSGSTWKATHPFLEQDERYLNLLGIPGSSPLDLFFDVVDELDMKNEENQRCVAEVLDGLKFIINEDTTFEELATAVAGDDRLASLDEEALRTVFGKMHGRVVRQAKEDRRRAEKKLRLYIDDLRYAYKKLDPPVSIDSTYEDNLERIQDTPEFKVLEDEASRRAAFDKFIKRQKEKLRERAHSDADSTEHRRDREREREPTSSRSHRDKKGGDSRHGYRSPEREEAKAKREASEDIESAPKRKAAKLAPVESGDVRMRDVKSDDEVEEGEID